MADLQLQPSIASDLRSQAMLRLVERLGALDVSPLLVYWIEHAPASALNYLLWQFDLLSPLWGLIAPPGTSPTIALRRIIEAGIRLHARRGTKQVVLDALDALGWSGADIQEGLAAWGNRGRPHEDAADGWAVCRLVVSLAPSASETAGIGVWNATAAYRPGDVVQYPSGGSPIRAFVAETAPPIGVPPYYLLLSDVPNVVYVKDFDNLTTIFWSEVGGGIRPLTPAVVALLIEAFYFFAPRRCYLDQIEGVAPPNSDVLPAFSDFPSDELPEFVDSLAVAWQSLSDSLSSPAQYDGRHTYGAGIDYSGDAVDLVDSNKGGT